MERSPFRGTVQTSIHADITSFISAHWLYLLYLLLGSPPCQLRHHSFASPLLPITLSLSFIPSLPPICILIFPYLEPLMKIFQQTLFEKKITPNSFWARNKFVDLWQQKCEITLTGAVNAVRCI